MYLLVQVRAKKRFLIPEVHFDGYEYRISKCFELENSFNDLNEAIEAKNKLTNNENKFVILETIN